MIDPLSQTKKVHQLFKKLVYRHELQFMRLTAQYQAAIPFEEKTWLRNQGSSGGGFRKVASSSDPFFNRAALNCSNVYFNEPLSTQLQSAVALSEIIHPAHPRAPSLHMHISWARFHCGRCGWRVMADLNPAIALPDRSVQQFKKCLQEVSGERYPKATLQGDQYFYIPVLRRGRGAVHFYLEAYHSGDFQADYDFAEQFAERVMCCYLGLVAELCASFIGESPEDKAKQLAFHTLYFFQVLTLDRGTTAGILIHTDNDLGILSSLPKHVDCQLLQKWQSSMPVPQCHLLNSIITILSKEGVADIDDAVKIQLAGCLRHHYRKFPQVLGEGAAP